MSVTERLARLEQQVESLNYAVETMKQEQQDNIKELRNDNRANLEVIKREREQANTVILAGQEKINKRLLWLERRAYMLVGALTILEYLLLKH